MINREGLLREVDSLRDRLSRLSEASLSIAEDLDLDAVLQGVVDGARSLTGASRGGITVLDQAGEFQAFVSSGLTAEEHQFLLDLPGGLEFFDFMVRTTEPIRVDDFSSYCATVGLPEMPRPAGLLQTFLAVPVRHRGRLVGNIYLSDKEEGAQFTREDEETLSMFASHVAMAITNAHRRRDEQQAKSDLETLVNTSPVGVVVFDARSGAPKYLNREALRIVDGLRDPEQSPEQLLELLSFRRSDGREISLQEFSLAQVLSAGETVRAEEIVIRVPDGRSVSIIINATPISSDGGEVETVVVTLQDMTAVKELERLRADFLAMVSHELRTPLSSVKGSVATLLDPSANLDSAETHQFHRIIDQQADRMRELIGQLLDVALIRTGTLAVDPQPVDLAVLVDLAHRAFLINGGRHGLSLHLPPGLPWVMADRARMMQVIGNLMSMVAGQSLASPGIRVSASQDGTHVAVSVADEGEGVPAEATPGPFPRFSGIDRLDRGSGIGGPGLGMTVCRGIVEAHGGRIWAESAGAGRGARFSFTVPAVEGAGTGLAAAGSRPGPALRVLAVDDDPQGLRHVRDILNNAGYAPVMAGNAEDALGLMATEQPRLVLLNPLMPGSDGIGLMQDIIAIADVPVIFLSEYARDEVIAQAMDAGADDYVLKPYSPTELAARIRAALRRRETPAPSGPYAREGLVVDYAQRRVTLSGSPVQLTAIEYRMLAELAANAGRVLTYDHLLQRVWGPDNSGDLRPMRTVVTTLRRKLEDDADSPRYIFTEARVGYRMAEPETPEDEPG